ncbi:MAG: hypothetical protein ONB46_17940 [candidate division KSB1 bacterium]|nr:hypothetical protein [candidate division KSB1 bacterium]MDZ7367683.1 hypothetical protein [candidate division KSB1 bacterium]MDZ7404802.1 hypothetical protein [candidate division KSB1 bacterium]
MPDLDFELWAKHSLRSTDQKTHHNTQDNPALTPKTAEKTPALNGEFSGYADESP